MLIEVFYKGYGGKFEQLKKQLLAKFPTDLEVVGSPTPTRTGYFEVQIVDGPLVWSKKQSNTFPSSQADLDKIFEAVGKAMA